MVVLSVKIASFLLVGKIVKFFGKRKISEKTNKIP
jgi:hypothetical protein